VASVLRAAAARVDGPGREDVRHWLAVLLAAVAEKPRREASTDAVRYGEGYTAMVAAIAELVLRCVAMSQACFFYFCLFVLFFCCVWFWVFVWFWGHWR
jgi:hypothetical protein